MLGAVGWEHAVTIALTGLVLGWWARAAQRPAEMVQDAIVMSYPPAARWLLRILGTFLLVVAIVGPIALALDPRRPDASPWLTLIFVPVAALGLCPIAEARVRLLLDANGLRGRTALRGERLARQKSIRQSTTPRRPQGPAEACRNNCQSRLAGWQACPPFG